MSSCENISTDLKNYYMFQAEISEMSELFGQNTEHVDKVILLNIRKTPYPKGLK